MANILTPAEAANFIRTDENDAVMLQLIPLVDQYLLNATGHDWTADSPVHNTAKIAAGMLIVHWYDNPLAVGQAPESFRVALLQLESEALKYRKYCFYGRNGAGGVALQGARIGDEIITLVGIYGVTGDQSDKFEAIVTAQDQIQQTDAGDLSNNQYVVVLKHPAEDVT
jgi:hypothetical protein